MSVIVPGTTELLDLRALPTDEIAYRLDVFAEMSRQVSDFRRAASDELAARLDHEGRRSADIGEWHVEVTPPTEKSWDITRLQSTLQMFIERGVISEAKANRCVRHKPEVVWREVKTLLSDPRTAPEISLCFEERPATRYAKVTRG